MRRTWRIALGVAAGLAVALSTNTAFGMSATPVGTGEGWFGPGEQIWWDWREIPWSNVITNEAAAPEPPLPQALGEPLPGERVDGLGMVKPAQTDWLSFGWVPDIRWPAHSPTGIAPDVGRWDPRGVLMPLRTNWPW